MKVLASPSSFGKISTEPVDLLKSAGYEIIDNPYGRKLTESEVVELAKDCIGIVAGVEPLTSKVMDELPKLRCISRVGIGMDNVDLEYAKIKNIIVTNTPDGPTRSVAEFTLAMTMSLLRKIPKSDSDLKQKKWNKHTGNLLFGKTIGVIGLGRIGRLVSELFRGLGNKVVGYDPYPNQEWCSAKGVSLVSMEELLANADILTIHVPGNSDGTPLIGHAQIAQIKKAAFIINISRGGIVDETALYNALKNGALSGAAIDVFTEEPYSGELCELDNVILTPHIGSYAEEGKVLMEIDAVNNLIEALKN